MRSLLLKIWLLLALVGLSLIARETVDAQSGTVNADPDFDQFYGKGDGTSGPWIPFYNSTPRPTIWKHPTEGWPKGPSLWIHADNMTYDGGVYQVVNVTPGHGYHFEVAWAVVRHAGNLVRDDVQLVRTIGIDPFGGTNPLSPNVHWCPDYYGTGKFPPELAIDDFARNTQITIFIRAQNHYPDSTNEVFIDHAVMTDNGSTTQVTLPTVAPTAAPKAAATATKVPPTATRPRVALAPTATSTPEPTATFTTTPSPTVATTTAPLATRTPRATPTPEPVETNPLSQAPSWLLALGMVVCVIGAGGLVVLAGVVYWFLHRRQNNLI